MATGARLPGGRRRAEATRPGGAEAAATPGPGRRHGDRELTQADRRVRLELQVGGFGRAAGRAG